MTHKIISYQTKPDASDRNAELVAGVFRELHATAPAGVKYLVLRAADGTFFHFVAYESDEANDQLTDLPAFDAFRQGGEARRMGPPSQTDVTIVGNYGMFAE